MGQTLDLGTRVELVSMDGHCHDISVALYQQPRPDGLVYLVHTYSGHEDAKARVAFLNAAMQVLGGMTATPDGTLRFPCGHAHPAAVKRLFLEACKLPTSESIDPRPMRLYDNKGAMTLVLSGEGGGVYSVGAEDLVAGGEARLTTIARAMMKLGQLDEVEGHDAKFAYACGHEHDALTGLLLIRAPNVRAALAEAAMMAARGVLAAPSGQDQGT